MVYSVATVAKMIRLFGVGLALVAILMPVGSAAATPNLQAIICGDTPASLTVTQPQSDSVINEHQVTLSGDVLQASQLEIYVDDAFDGVEPLAYDAKTYATTVQLSPGTHTIKLIAIDTCQVGNATASVVLTYQPISTPSVGGQIATDVNGSVTGLEEVSTAQAGIFERFVISPLMTAGESLNLVTHSPSSVENNFSNIVRFSIIISGLSLIGLSASIHALMLEVITRMNITSAIVVAIRSIGRRVTIWLGVAMIIGVFLL